MRWARPGTVGAILCAAVALLGGCGEDSTLTSPVPSRAAATVGSDPPPDRRPEPPGPPPRDAPAPAPPVEAKPAADDTLFVEMLSEVSTAPMRPAPDFDRTSRDSGRPFGYVLAADLSRLTFYPALGKPLPERPRFWLGRRLRDHVARARHDLLALEAVHHGTHVWEPKGLFPASVRTTEAGGRVSVSVDGGAARTIEPGEVLVLVDTERRAERPMLAEFLASRTPHLSREEIDRAVAERYPGEGAVTFRFRVAARLQRVAMGDNDVLHEWNKADEAMRAGDYVTAEAGFESVVAVLPDQEDAALALATVSSLVERGARSAVLRGTVRFPSARPSETDRALWARFHSGFATLAPAEGGPGSDAHSRLAPVRDGAFTVTVPRGSYRLTISVPGFRAVERAVDLAGPTDLEVTLEEGAR